jgi:hypothetical protein
MSLSLLHIRCYIMHIDTTGELVNFAVMLLGDLESVLLCSRVYCTVTVVQSS